MKIVAVISSLGAGGAERVLTMLVNYWVSQKHEVTLLTFDKGEQQPHYELNSKVNLLPLSLLVNSRSVWDGLLNNLRRVRSLRARFKSIRPDVIISFVDQTNVLTLLASRGMKSRVIVSERINPLFHNIGYVWQFLRRFVYRFADKIIVQTSAVAEVMPSGLYPKIDVIPNPIMANRIAKGESDKVKPKKQIVAMGRLVNQKGFDLLIRAFSEVYVKNPDWSLTIWGEGPDRKSLENLRDSLQLSDKVKLPGITQAPLAAMQNGKIFVLSSRYEGFPNVLLEAMALGLPVIAADCPSGPSEIIQDNINGLLVAPEDSEMLAESLDRLIGDLDLQRALGEKAQGISKQYSLQCITHQWDTVLRGT